MAGLPPPVGRLFALNVIVRLLRPLPRRLPLLNVGPVIVPLLVRVFRRKQAAPCQFESLPERLHAFRQTFPISYYLSPSGISWPQGKRWS